MGISHQERDVYVLPPSSVSSAQQIDELSQETLFKATLLRYFRKVVVHAPDLRWLAALAQFDIAVPQRNLPDPFEPGHAGFVHASAPEVVFRALCWAAAEGWESAAVDIGSYLVDAEDRDLLPALAQFAKSRLKLADDSGLKRSVLSDLRLVSRLERIRSQSCCGVICGGGGLLSTREHNPSRCRDCRR